MQELAERLRKRIESSRHGDAWLGLASYLESIVVPIPLEVVLVPYLLAHRERAWRTATVVTTGCLLGALTGYGVGFHLMEGLGASLVQALGWGEAMESFRSTLEEDGFWAILGIGIAPVPFQVAMLTAGAAGYPLPLFVLAAVIARGIRYYGLAALIVALGDRGRRFWEEHSAAILTIAGGLCIAIAAFSLLRG